MIIFIFMIIFPIVAQADSAPITVEPILPDQQKQGVKGYYHLELNEGRRVQLQVQVSNQTDQPVTVLLTPLNAYSNPAKSTGIQYNEQDTERHQLLNKSLSMKKHLQQKEVDMKANETKSVPFTVDLSGVHEGQWLGAIQVSTIDQADNTQTMTENETNVVIKHQFTYTIPIEIDFNQVPETDFSFGDVRFDYPAGGTELLIEMQNPTTGIVRDISVTYRLEAASGEVLLDGGMESFGLVPNTSAAVPIKWDRSPLGPGEYTLFLEAVYDGKKITDEKELVINRKESEKMEESIDADEEETNTFSIPMWVIIVLGLLLAVIFVFLGVWIGRRRAD
ncbi:hypothetical protein GCM10008986_32690 [Salinibacillus aidingensis]|uniref:DUF3324 domain-containing protein n=1 Tax=Salinibacillus aidingensis TaxID=237684 RepID=A0ABP3LM33_9BACI